MLDDRVERVLGAVAGATGVLAQLAPSATDVVACDRAPPLEG